PTLGAGRSTNIALSSRICNHDSTRTRPKTLNLSATLRPRSKVKRHNPRYRRVPDEPLDRVLQMDVNQSLKREFKEHDRHRDDCDPSLESLEPPGVFEGQDAREIAEHEADPYRRHVELPPAELLLVEVQAIEMIGMLQCQIHDHRDRSGHDQKSQRAA